MKQTSQLRIHQREKRAQEIRRAIFDLSVSAATMLGLINKSNKSLYAETKSASPPPVHDETLYTISPVLCVSLQRSARVAAEESDAVFTELIRSIELKRFEVRELMNAQEKAAVGQAEQLLDKIQKEIAVLKKNEKELDKLSHTEDHVRFLQVPTLELAPPVVGRN